MSVATGPDLSVIIPAYNEEKRLGKTVGSIAGYLSSKKFDYELIVVDDGSSDDTSGVASAAGRLVPGFRLLKIRLNVCLNLGSRRRPSLPISAPSILRR